MTPITKVKHLIVALLLVLTSAIAVGQVYKVTDKDGNVSYTDRPPTNTDADIEKLDIKGVNSATPPPVIRTNSRPTERETANIDYNTEITSPPDGTTIPMGGGEFGVGSQISPPLAPGEKLLLKLDGAAVGGPQQSSTWQLTNVFRGEHTLTVERLGADGSVLDSSPAVTVFVLRPGLLRR